MTAYPEEGTARTGAPADPPAGAAGGAGNEPASVGELVSEISRDVSTLMRQQVELAKAELRQEATKAGAGAGMLGGASLAGYLALLFLTVAAMVGLGHVIGLGWSALVVAVMWALAALALFTTGRSRLRGVHPKPERTIETLKEDAQWARHPTS